MHWKSHQNISQVTAELPDGSFNDVWYAIPDIYSHALQLHFLLEEAVSKQKYNSDAVRLWRGLLTLIALKDYLELPLSWERVVLQGNSRNLLNNALVHPPAEAKNALFSAKNQLWDGKTFFVLKWNFQNEKPIDLLLYSPVTLIFPVADWRNVYTRLDSLSWYDKERKEFLAPESILNAHEKEIVYFWLSQVAGRFTSDVSNSAQRNIRMHINEYMYTLNTPKIKKGFFQLVDITGLSADLDELPGVGKTVRAVLAPNMLNIPQEIKTNKIFSDQICYFECNQNPFQQCQFSNNYIINSRPNCYAFLPINKDMWPADSDLVKDLKLTWSIEDEKEYIMASITINGKSYEQKYRVLDKASEEPCKLTEKHIAIPYGEVEAHKMPLVAIWPDRVDEDWKNYYVMLDGTGCSSGDLQIAQHCVCKTGSNEYVVQVESAPKMIPIVKKITETGNEISVGIITPRLNLTKRNSANAAVVAVDLGTSSTRVFYKIGAKIDELDIRDDYPTMVTECHQRKVLLVRDNFIPPDTFKRSKGTLFSIYRRGKYFKHHVEPILDGVIYQPSYTGALYAVELSEDAGTNLISDLKWNRDRRPYYTAFMKQLLLHVTILLARKGVNKITWKYALPENMGGIENQVKEIWEQELIPYLKKVSNMQHDVVDRTIESEATSKYFFSNTALPVDLEKGYLVVDIGGGSSDIALWQGTGQRARMLWHTSVNVAGRKLFTRLISEELQNLCEDVREETLKGHIYLIKNEKDENRRNVLTEILLNANFADLLNNYLDNCQEHPDGWGNRLCLEINKGISLLLFALGYQIGALMKNGSFSVPAGQGAFVIAFGGRGANILKWRNVSEEKIVEFFKAGIHTAGAAANVSVRIAPSQDPKCEVAKGLLEEMPFKRDPDTTPVITDMSVSKYITAAESFINAFDKSFHKLSSSSELPLLDSDHITAAIHKSQSDINEIVNIFMETMYDEIVK